MIYKCIHKHPRLTIGKIYYEWAHFPNAFNAMVWNDEDDVETFPREQFFESIEE